MTAPAPRRLILASTSPYRRELLARLRLPFDVAAPGVDESARPGESPLALTRRLAFDKASAVATHAPGAWVIGSDQLAELDGKALGKPGRPDVAFTQLASMSGREVVFRTALSLVHSDGRRLDAQDETRVAFRTLTAGEISRYVEAEQPLDCAGSFKSEGLGIALFSAIRTVDPTALVGLPLIATARLLREAGFALP
ncbi:Maf family protein [Cognatiluteimonas telluris]|uniref:Maf family protein n=1 Tax=Cognatiluteimonas telluris TaxID=1104775 RepID=UPI00140A3F5F|nr:nucleoside triphosphate pyrophosphatase [Lysobacter telluris]